MVPSVTPETQPQVLPIRANCELEIAKPPAASKLAAVPPLLERVSTKLELEPTLTLPKASGLGVMVMSGATPVPVRPLLLAVVVLPDAPV